MAFCKPFCFITSLFKNFLCNNSYNKNTWISDLLSEHFFQIRIQTFQKEKNPTLSLRKTVFSSVNHATTNFILKRVTSVNKKYCFTVKRMDLFNIKNPQNLRSVFYQVQYAIV